MIMIHKNWQELIRPTALEIKTGADSHRQATAVAEPLERGFGLTLGNALRRVLLSSLQGAAITSVQIDGVLHEFSSVPGVREDVTDIVLNLKGVAVKMEVEGPKRVEIRATGPGVVTAGDITTTNGIEILNRDHVILHLDDGASVYMELTVETGKGYVQADKNRPEDAPIGLISVDALFSPIKKVSYKVEPTREGQVLDYDKLTLQLETDGSVKPEDAIAYAARILQDQLSVFVNFEEPSSGVRSDEAEDLEFNPLLLKKVDELELARSLGKLPEERQHRLYRRPDPEDRGGDAPHPEFRAQVAERDQGSADWHGPASRYGDRRLAAGEHRGPGQEVRGPVLKFAGSLRAPRTWASRPKECGPCQGCRTKYKSAEGKRKCVTEAAIAS